MDEFMDECYISTVKVNDYIMYEGLEGVVLEVERHYGSGEDFITWVKMWNPHEELVSVLIADRLQKALVMTNAFET